jgi:hypothetical protein
MVNLRASRRYDKEPGQCEGPGIPWLRRFVSVSPAS